MVLLEFGFLLSPLFSIVLLSSFLIIYSVNTDKERNNMFVCLCFTSLQLRGHLETIPPFTVPCERREAR